MKKLALFTIIVLVCGSMSPTLVNHAYGQNDPSILLRIAVQADKQIVNQLDKKYENKIPNNINILYDKGHRAVKSLDQSLSNNDIEKAKQDFLLAMNSFMQISRIMSQSSEKSIEVNVSVISNQALESKIDRIEKFVQTWEIESHYDNHNEMLSNEKLDLVSICTHDDSHFEIIKDAIDKGVKNIVSFGKGDGAEFNLKEYNETFENSSVSAVCNSNEIKYELGVFGIHNALNSISVLALVDSVGGCVSKAASSFSEFEPRAGRGKRICVEGDFGSVTIIDDTYNASPAAVRASLKVLGDIKCNYNNRIIAVLGDMFELGENAEQLHEGLADNIIDNNVDMVFTAGKLTQSLYNKLPENIKGANEATSSDIAQNVFESLQDGDVVLVKGSRGMKMENVVNHIVHQRGIKNAV